MGSWNETCALSNLPICEGDDIVGIILGKHPYAKGGEVCNISDNFIPYSFLIKGKYGDYGQIVDIENDEMLTFLLEHEYYKQVNIENGGYKYKRYNYLNVSEFLTDIAHNDVFVESHFLDFSENIPKNKNTYSSLIFMFMHKGLFDILMKNIENREYNGVSFLTSSKKKVETSFLKYIMDCEKSKCPILIDLSEYIHLGCNNALGFRIVDYYISLISFENFSTVTFLDNLVELKIFESLLEALRSGYWSYTGKGNQSREYYIHKVKAEWVLKYYEKKI